MTTTTIFSKFSNFLETSSTCQNSEWFVFSTNASLTFLAPHILDRISVWQIRTRKSCSKGPLFARFYCHLVTGCQFQSVRPYCIGCIFQIDHFHDYKTSIEDNKFPFEKRKILSQVLIAPICSHQRRFVLCVHRQTVFKYSLGRRQCTKFLFNKKN